MTVFRWIMGVLFLLTGGGAALCFAAFMAIDDEIWIVRARKLRRGAYLAMLFWFNVEIWGRVVWTIIHW